MLLEGGYRPDVLLKDESKMVARFTFYLNIFYPVYSVKITREDQKRLIPISISNLSYLPFTISILKKNLFLKLVAIITLFAINVVRDCFFVGSYKDLNMVLTHLPLPRLCHRQT